MSKTAVLNFYISSQCAIPYVANRSSAYIVNYDDRTVKLYFYANWKIKIRRKIILLEWIYFRWGWWCTWILNESEYLKIYLDLTRKMIKNMSIQTCRIYQTYFHSTERKEIISYLLTYPFYNIFQIVFHFFI